MLTARKILKLHLGKILNLDFTTIHINKVAKMPVSIPIPTKFINKN